MHMFDAVNIYICLYIYIYIFPNLKRSGSPEVASVAMPRQDLLVGRGTHEVASSPIQVPGQALPVGKGSPEVAPEAL